MSSTSSPTETSAGPSLSVVAPTYQRRGSLPRFLGAVLADPAVSELVLAVDGSTDGSLQWLREQARLDPRIVVLDLPNRGNGAARQAGIEAASGDVVLLLDDDVIAGPGLASGHLRHHRDGARRLVLGYMPNDWRSLPPGRRAIAYLYSSAYERRCARYASEPDFVLRGLWSGNLSLPREEFLRTPVDELLAGYGEEDREWGLRCLKGGVEGRFDPALIAQHEFDRSIGQYRHDCYRKGRFRRAMFELHGDVLGEDLEIGRTLPGPLRSLLPWLARGAVFRALALALTALFEIGVRLRWFKLECFAARGLGSLETQRGALQAR